jgi:predicted anti-sigma-YlaC factor YlaD
MNPRRTVHGRSSGAFLCRYVDRTIAQLGEEALTLPLVSRHLTQCPACRAQRRRVARVDRALQLALLEETPACFDGRWADLCDRIPELRRRSPMRALRTLREHLRVVGALAAVLAIAIGAWQIDHPSSTSAEEALAVAPGVTVTEATIGGLKASVEVEVNREENENGTVYLRLKPEPASGASTGDRR